MRDTPNWKKWCAIVKKHGSGTLTTREDITRFRNMQLELNELWKSLSREERRWALESGSWNIWATDEEFYKEIETNINEEYYVSPDCLMPSVEEIEINTQQYVNNKPAKYWYYTYFCQPFVWFIFPFIILGILILICR